MKENEKKVPQDQSFLQKIPLWFLFYTPTVFLLVITMGYSVYFLIIDPDPPQMPPSSSQMPIDCTKIHFKYVSSYSSKISLSFDVDDFIQYPISSAMSMLQVIISSSNSQSTYTYKNFWDQKSNISHIFFNILHPFQGNNFDLEVKCGALSLGRKPISIETVTVYPVGWSILFNEGMSHVKIADGCFNNNSFVICAPPPQVSFKPMQLSSDNQVTVNHTMLSAESYASYNNISMHKTERHLLDSIFIGANPKHAYKKITDILLPLWAFIFDKQDHVNNMTLVTFHEQNDLMPFIKNIYNGKINKSTETKFCFSSGLVLGSSDLPSYNNNMKEYNNPSISPYLAETYYYEYISRLNDQMIHRLKQRISASDDQVKPNTKKHIVLDHGSKIIYSTLEKLYPNAKLTVISDADPLNLIQHILSKADIYITSDIKRGAYSIFMNSGTHLVELAPKGLGCFHSCRQWAKLFQLQYSSIYSSDECVGKSLYDYMRFLDSAQYPLIREENLKAIIDPLM